jgi:alkanesulfonate monooxygenase SsuD/methylene tetrahydromethanopterin reductase-like flavin-dependent oxidoreductase (luciferase family)
VDFSLIYELASADTSDAGVERTYRQFLEQVQLADRLGYRAVWLTEHHFLPGFSFSSAPELMLTLAAAHTTRIRLGHAIVLLPFAINHPLRVAERIATLDVISGGRVEFGGGRAISESELAAFGVEPDATRAQWEEALRMLPAMWSGYPFKWESPMLSIPERDVVPKPIQKPHPPMWVSATQPSTVEFAARHGLGVLGFGITAEQSNDLLELYRREIATCKPIGAFVNNRFALWVHALCCPTDAEAIAVQGPNLKRYVEDVRMLFAPWIDGKPPKSYEWFMKNFAAGYDQMKAASAEDIVRGGGACIGSPKTCREMIQVLADAGVDEVMLFMQSYTTPHDRIMRSIELFATEVAPAIKSPSAQRMAG